jgi:glycosyltransferase involved in cell wall biosynthesis
VDDCSTDNSYKIAQYLNKQFDFNLVQTPKNSKLPGARNFGIKQTSGQYLVCLDADDKLPGNYVLRNYNNIKVNGVDVSYCNSACFDGASNTYNWPEFS